MGDHDLQSLQRTLQDTQKQCEYFMKENERLKKEMQGLQASIPHPSQSQAPLPQAPSYRPPSRDYDNPKPTKPKKKKKRRSPSPAYTPSMVGAPVLVQVPATLSPARIAPIATPFGIIPRQIPPMLAPPSLVPSIVQLPQPAQPKHHKKKKPKKYVPPPPPESSSSDESSDESSDTEEEEVTTRYVPVDRRLGPGFPPGFPHHMFPPGSTVEVTQKLPRPQQFAPQLPQYVQSVPRALPVTNLSLAGNLANLPYAVGTRSILL